MARKTIFVILLSLLCATTIKADYYAVLIVGEELDTNTWTEHNYLYDAFWNDTFLVWEMLWTYGWKNDNIHVLFGNGEDWDDPIGNDRYNAYERYRDYGIYAIVNYPAGYEDVENILTWLANGDSAQGIPQMTYDDFLFVWTYGHGNADGENIAGLKLDLNTTTMWDTTFADLMDQCEYDKRVIFMQQCFSGGFIDDLENNRTFVMTAVDFTFVGGADDNAPDGGDPRENEIYTTAPDTIIYHHGEFDYHVINAVRLQTIVGNSLTSYDSVDVDSNGLASLTEVWNWEENKDTVSEPQVSDEGEIGDFTFLNIPPYKPTGLTGERVNNRVKLTWDKNEEYDLDHYEIFKRSYCDSLQLYCEWAYQASTTDTTYTDSTFFPSYQGADTVWYKITAVDEASQSSEYSDVVTGPGFIRPLSDDLAGMISCLEEFIIMDNYPDPFNPVTTINYTLPEAAFVELKVYDVCGREVATLVNEHLSAGSHLAVFDGSNLPSGVYIYRINAGGYTASGKMLLIK